MIRLRSSRYVAAIPAVLVASWLLAASPMRAQQAQTVVSVPQPEVLLSLIRTGLAALDHANKTGNYSVLREISGPAFQANTSGQLSNMFSQIRTSGVDLTPTLVVTPQLTETPAVNPQGQMLLSGFFPTRPHQISFQMLYQPVAGQWRLQGLAVSLQLIATPSAPAAGGETQPQSALQPAKPKAAAPAATEKPGERPGDKSAKPDARPK